MKLVSPETQTSLSLNKYHQTGGRIFTARAAIRHLITGRVKGVAADGYVYDWTGEVSWSNGNVPLHEDQPYIRSAPDSMGNEKRWYIPTVVVCSEHFGYHSHKGENVSLKKVFAVYKGICQFCLESIPYAQATKDHLFPKSLGGTNHDFNIVLSCRRCNNKKDSQYPYFNAEGKEVKSRYMNSGILIPDEKDMRPEWRPYFYLE